MKDGRVVVACEMVGWWWRVRWEGWGGRERESGRAAGERIAGRVVAMSGRELGREGRGGGGGYGIGLGEWWQWGLHYGRKWKKTQTK